MFAPLVHKHSGQMHAVLHACMGMHVECDGFGIYTMTHYKVHLCVYVCMQFSVVALAYVKAGDVEKAEEVLELRDY